MIETIKTAFAEENQPGQVILLEPSVVDNKPINSFTGYASVMFSTIFSLAVLIAIVTMAYGGLVYASAEKIESKKDAVNRITNSLVGLFLALAAWLILNTINPDLVNFSLHL